MFKFLALIGTLYGVGILGVGINHTVAAWGTQDISIVIGSGLREGLSWPATFIGWLA